MTTTPEQPSAAELAAALAATGYRYSDPVADPEHPRITAVDELADPVDAFPPGWGDEPTERDQAAIAAGNA